MTWSLQGLSAGTFIRFSFVIHPTISSSLFQTVLALLSLNFKSEGHKRKTPNLFDLFIFQFFYLRIVPYFKI